MVFIHTNTLATEHSIWWCYCNPRKSTKNFQRPRRLQNTRYKDTKDELKADEDPNEDSDEDKPTTRKEVKFYSSDSSDEDLPEDEYAPILEPRLRDLRHSPGVVKERSSSPV